MSTTHSQESFISLRRAATRLGVPAAWLRAEALAGRIPHLRVGRRLLFNPTAVEAALFDRAAEPSAPQHNPNGGCPPGGADGPR